MRLVRCDRCGKLIKPTECAELHINLTRYPQRVEKYVERTFDICEECENEFLDLVIDFWYSNPNSIFAKKEEEEEG
ncbi:MAG: hypothetical protein QXW39_07385 [Candidatus Bathyarchaeia archaeon]